MPHEMVGFKELKSFNDRKREEENSKYVKAAVDHKNTMAKMSDKDRGRWQAYNYATSMYLLGFSGERAL